MGGVAGGWQEDVAPPLRRLSANGLTPHQPPVHYHHGKTPLPPRWDAARVRCGRAPAAATVGWCGGQHAALAPLFAAPGRAGGRLAVAAGGRGNACGQCRLTAVGVRTTGSPRDREGLAAAHVHNTHGRRLWRSCRYRGRGWSRSSTRPVGGGALSPSRLSVIRTGHGTAQDAAERTPPPGPVLDTGTTEKE